MHKVLFTSLVFFCLTSISAQNIFRSVCQGKLSRLDSLLQHTSIDIQDNRGRSLLHWAVGCQQNEVFDYLLNQGISINIEDQQKRIPAHVSIQRNDIASFDALYALQTDTTWIRKYGTSFLELALLQQSSTFVSRLAELGAPINEVNERGSTPIEIADRLGAKEIYDLLIQLGADEKAIRRFTMKGDYMGQENPGLIPQLFAPNFISTEEQEFGAVFNAAGDEFYFGVDVNGKNEIRYSLRLDDIWTTPQVLLSHDRYGYNDPFLSPEEDRLYFISNQALDGNGEPKDIDIWYIEKTGTGWSEPINAGPNINTNGNEYYISFTTEGTMFFSSNGQTRANEDRTDHDIYSSRYVNDEFQVPMRQSEAVNTTHYEGDVFVAPDESYLIFCAERDEGYGRGDLYISFKDGEGKWTQSMNMGNEINTKFYEYCPFVTQDGKYLMFTRNQDIYWVSTAIINDLEAKQQESKY